MLKYYFKESAETKLKFIEENEEKLERAIKIISNSLTKKKKILVW